MFVLVTRLFITYALIEVYDFNSFPGVIIQDWITVWNLITWTGDWLLSQCYDTTHRFTFAHRSSSTSGSHWSLPALDWAAAAWDSDSQVCVSFDYIFQLIQEVFKYPAGGHDVLLQLLQLSQGNSMLALTAQSGWKNAVLKAICWSRLNRALQREMACKEKGLDESQLVLGNNYNF